MADRLDPRLLWRDWFELESRVDAYINLLSLDGSYRFRSPFKPTIYDAEKLRRTFFEIEAKVRRLLAICCPVCRFAIPFPYPWNRETKQLIGWQLRRDLLEIEKAVNDISACQRKYLATVQAIDFTSQLRFWSYDEDALTVSSVLDTPVGTTGFGWNASKGEFAAGSGSTLQVYATGAPDPTTWSVTRSFTFPPASFTTPDSVRFVPGLGDQLSMLADDAVTGERVLLLVSAADGSLVYVLRSSDLHLGTVRDIADYGFSQDGSLFGAVFADGEINVWSRDTGTLLYSNYGLGTAAASMGISDDSRFLWWVDAAVVVHVFDVTSWTEVATSPGGVEAGCLCLAPGSDMWFQYTARDVLADTATLRFSNFDFTTAHETSAGSSDIGNADWTESGLTLIEARNSVAGGFGNIRMWRKSDFTDVDGVGTDQTSIRVRPFVEVPATNI